MYKKWFNGDIRYKVGTFTVRDVVMKGGEHIYSTNLYQISDHHHRIHEGLMTFMDIHHKSQNLTARSTTYRYSINRFY